MKIYSNFTRSEISSIYYKLQLKLHIIIMNIFQSFLHYERSAPFITGRIKSIFVFIVSLRNISFSTDDYYKHV